MSQPTRALILHPEPRVREELENLLRRTTGVALQSASSPAEGIRLSAWFEPDLVLVDLGAGGTGSRAASLAIVRDLRAPGRLVVGLHNPLLQEHRGEALFREAVRAGIGDFLALPPSEAELRAILEDAEPPPESRRRGGILAFYGPKGGVGTTTLAVNVALLLAGSGEAGQVALCDADLQFGDAAALMGLSPDTGLGDLVRELDDPGALAPFLTRHDSTGLHVLSRPSSLEMAEGVRPDDLTRILLLLQRRFDRIVVDTSSVLDLLNAAVFDLAEKVFVVTEAVAPAVVSTARLLRALEELGLAPERIRVVLNRYSAFEGNLPPGTVAEHLGRPVDHVLAEDRSVVTAAHQGRPAILGRARTNLTEVLGQIADDAVRPVRPRPGASRNDPAGPPQGPRSANR